MLFNSSVTQLYIAVKPIATLSRRGLMTHIPKPVKRINNITLLIFFLLPFQVIRLCVTKAQKRANVPDNMPANAICSVLVNTKVTNRV